MTPTEFVEKYKIHRNYLIPVYSGKEIKQDVLDILSKTEGFSRTYRGGSVIVAGENETPVLTRNTVEMFKKQFMDSVAPISDDCNYTLELVGKHDDVLIVRKVDSVMDTKYKFDSEFVDANDTVMRISCEAKDEYFYVLIDTWHDPYDVYYNCNKPEDEETFRTELFDYLVKKYPDYF